MSKFEAIIKKINIAKTHKIGLITSLLMAFFGTLYGYFNRSALAYGAVYSFRALGLYILFYCLKCYSEGAENLVRNPASYKSNKFAYADRLYGFLKGVPLYHETTVSNFITTVLEAKDVREEEPSVELFKLPAVDVYHW
jgi:hypothetical protein